jgi:putative phosphoribosyl transferase
MIMDPMYDRGEARFRDREEAGRALGVEVAGAAGLVDPIVLALPRGGVPVGVQVARALGAPLDVLVVRKLGFPGQPELAMGAVAAGGVRVLNRELLGQVHLPPATVEEVARRELSEVERRERAYRGDARPLQLAGRSVILVDDGLATGSTMSAAVAAVRQLAPREVIIAVPLAPPDTIRRLRREADRVLCLFTPEPFLAIGSHYESFPQLDDREVVALLSRAREEAGAQQAGAQPRGYGQRAS